MIKKILGVEFTDLNMDDCTDLIMKALEKEDQETFHVMTANPEIIMQINRDEKLKTISKKSAMITADGIGVIYGSKILKNKINHKVTGVDLIVKLMERCEKENKSMYLLGANEETSLLMLDHIKKNYPKLKVAGRKNGFFDVKNDQEIVADINQSNADLLIMAMGSPRSHLWFDSRREILDIKATIDVGGSFDALTGTVKRAPKIIQKLNLEWFYRRLQNRERAKRQKDLYRFVAVVFKERFSKNKKYN